MPMSVQNVNHNRINSSHNITNFNSAQYRPISTTIPSQINNAIYNNNLYTSPRHSPPLNLINQAPILN